MGYLGWKLGRFCYCWVHYIIVIKRMEIISVFLQQDFFFIVIIIRRSSFVVIPFLPSIVKNDLFSAFMRHTHHNEYHIPTFLQTTLAHVIFSYNISYL